MTPISTREQRRARGIGRSIMLQLVLLLIFVSCSKLAELSQMSPPPNEHQQPEQKNPKIIVLRTRALRSDRTIPLVENPPVWELEQHKKLAVLVEKHLRIALE